LFEKLKLWLICCDELKFSVHQVKLNEFGREFFELRRRVKLFAGRSLVRLRLKHTLDDGPQFVREVVWDP
jgi:hypothetical protein